MIISCLIGDPSIYYTYIHEKQNLSNSTHLFFLKSVIPAGVYPCAYRDPNLVKSETPVCTGVTGKVSFPGVTGQIVIPAPVPESR